MVPGWAGQDPPGELRLAKSSLMGVPLPFADDIREVDLPPTAVPEDRLKASLPKAKKLISRPDPTRRQCVFWLHTLPRVRCHARSGGRVWGLGGWDAK